MNLKLLTRSLCVLGISVNALAATSHAQNVSNHAPANLCWRGQPTPRCDAFLITEFGGTYSLNRPTAKVRYARFGTDTTDYYVVRQENWSLRWEVGAMKNISSKTALGATALFGVFGEGLTVGVKGRYRRWLSPQGIALDVGVGVRTARDLIGVSYDTGPYYIDPPVTPAFTGDVAINVKDYAALLARVDVERYGGRYQPTVSLGIRTGSQPALFATGGLLTTYGVLIALFVFAYHGD